MKAIFGRTTELHEKNYMRKVIVKTAILDWSARLFFLSITFSLAVHADPLLFEPSPSPLAGVNDSFPVVTYTHSPDDRDHQLLPSDYASDYGSGDGDEDPFDLKKHRPPFWLILESGHVLLIGLSALEELLSAAINSLLNGDYDIASEPEDGGTDGTDATNSQQTTDSSDQGSGPIKRFCFSAPSTSGGAAGGDGDDPRKNQNLPKTPGSAVTTCSSDDDEEEEDDDGTDTNFVSSWPPAIKEWDTICQQPTVSEEVQRHIASYERVHWFMLPVNTPGYRNRTPLHICAMRGNLDLMRRLISRYQHRGMLDVQVPGRNEETLLFCAVSYGHYALAEYLLGMGAYPGGGSVISCTCLHLVANRGDVRDVRIVKLLLAYGAPVASVTNDGETALHYAASAGSIKIMEILLMHSPLKNYFEPNQKFGTPLHAAALNNEMEAVQYLVEHGAPIDVVCEDGYSALQFAQQQGNNEVVKYLSNPPPVRLNPPSLQFQSCSFLWRSYSSGNIFVFAQFFGRFAQLKLKNFNSPFYFRTVLEVLGLEKANVGIVSTDGRDAQESQE